MALDLRALLPNVYHSTDLDTAVRLRRRRIAPWAKDKSLEMSSRHPAASTGSTNVTAFAGSTGSSTDDRFKQEVCLSAWENATRHMKPGNDNRN